MSYPRLAARLYNAPLLLAPDKAAAIESVFRAYCESRGDTLPKFETVERPALAAGAIRTAPEGYQVTADGIAVISVLGSLVQRSGGMDALSGMTSYQSIGSQLAAADADRTVRGIVMDVDSPGGEVAGAFELASRINTSTKPIYAHANELAASAAYLIGSAANKLNVATTGMVGSIGVVMLHVDQSVRDAKQGMKYTPIYAGDRKVDFNPHEPLSNEALAIAQVQIDDLYSLFVDTVASHRGMDASAVKETQAGMLNAKSAVDSGFADGIATLAQTVDQMRADLMQPGALRRGFYAASPQGDESMPITQADLDAAVAKATTDAIAQAKAESDAAIAAKALESDEAAKVAAKAAQTRVAAILDHSEAKGREALARHLAFNTALTAEEAAAMLTAAPKVEANANPLHAKLTGTNPKAGADAGDPTTQEVPVIKAANVYALRAESAKKLAR